MTFEQIERIEFIAALFNGVVRIKEVSVAQL